MDDLFDSEESRRQRDEGMSKASQSQHAISWQAAAGRWFMALPVGTKFTPDDLIRMVGLPASGVNRNNAVGSFFNSLAKRGFIRWTGSHTKSDRVKRHAGENKVWIKIK